MANIRQIIKKAREFHKNIYFCFIDYAKDFDCVDHNKLENSSRDGNTRAPDLPLEKEATVRTGHGTTDFSKQEKEYVKAVSCRPAYLTYMQNIS